MNSQNTNKNKEKKMEKRNKEAWNEVYFYDTILERYTVTKKKKEKKLS